MVGSAGSTGRPRSASYSRRTSLAHHANSLQKPTRQETETVAARGRRSPGTRQAVRRLQPSLDVLEDRVVLSSAGVSLGTAAQYGVLGLANTKIVNSLVTINGDEGVSQGGKLNNAAPSTITGSVFESTQGQYSGPGKLGGAVNIAPALLLQAGQDAVNASSQAAVLTPTQTLGAVSTPNIVTGNGGLNVIDVNGGIKASLTLSGTANDVFIVNVTGTLALGGSSVLGLSGGVTADHVLYNFTAVGDTITTHVGNVLNGTLLAPQSSFNLDGAFNGEIIGGGGAINLLSGAQVDEVPFSGARPGQAYQATSADSKGPRFPG